MKTNKLQKILIGSVTFVAVFILGTSIVFAYKGNPNVHGKDYSQERHEKMMKTFDTEDYKEWSSLMKNRGIITKIIHSDNFKDFAYAHELALMGDKDGAKEIKEELGLGLGNKQQKHFIGRNRNTRRIGQDHS